MWMLIRQVLHQANPILAETTMMATPINSDWRYKDDNFQKRSFVLSGFVRMKMPLTREVYEFCDYIISQGYQFDLGSLVVVDRQILEEYNKYKEANG